jgi:hypothetical protein
VKILDYNPVHLINAPQELTKTSWITQSSGQLGQHEPSEIDFGVLTPPSRDAIGGDREERCNLAASKGQSLSADITLMIG